MDLDVRQHSNGSTAVETDRHAATPRAVPAAPGGLPVLGHALQLGRDPMGFMESLLPLGDVVRIDIGRRPVYVVNSLELVHEILVGQVDNFRRGVIFEKAKKVLGRGLTVAEGDFHRRQRQLLQPVLHRRQIVEHVDSMVEVAQDRVASWQAGAVIDANTQMHDLGMDIFSRSLFSADLAADSSARVKRATPAFMAGIVAHSLYPTALLEHVPLKVNKEFTRARVEMVEAVDEIIAGFRSRPGDEDDLPFLGHLIAAKERRTGRTMNHDQLRDEVVNLVVAGAEAPGTSLAWLFHELSIHPDVEERVAAEVIGALQGRRLGIDDLVNLPFTAAVVKETLRLHTPTWFLSRHTLDPTTLGGYHLPEDAEIAFSLTLLHRHSAHYDDPAAFDPERWLDGRTDDLPQSAYLPFGAGKHGCLGESFTQQVMTVATATIIQRWRLVRTGPAPTEVPVALVQAKGLHLRAEPRQGASAATLPTPS